jgi:TolA-binding protein
MWMKLRKMIKTSKEAIRQGKLTMAVYHHLAEHQSDDKKNHADAMLKYGQVEAKVMADERALRILQNLDLNNPNLYQPVKE